MSRRSHRLVIRTAVATWACAAGVLLSGCEAPRPDVTFYTNRVAVDTPPTRWCTVDAAAESVSCEEAAPGDVPRLPGRPGDPVQINVPSAITEAPWQVYFRYLDADGELADGRSPVFTDGRLAYTLRPIAGDDQLTYVEVQSGFILTPRATGGVDFAATQGWLVLIDPPPADPVRSTSSRVRTTWGPPTATVDRWSVGPDGA